MLTRSFLFEFVLYTCAKLVFVSLAPRWLKVQLVVAGVAGQRLHTHIRKHALARPKHRHPVECRLLQGLQSPVRGGERARKIVVEVRVRMGMM